MFSIRTWFSKCCNIRFPAKWIIFCIYIKYKKHALTAFLTAGGLKHFNYADNSVLLSIYYYIYLLLSSHIRWNWMTRLLHFPLHFCHRILIWQWTSNFILFNASVISTLYSHKIALNSVFKKKYSLVLEEKCKKYKA